jgi:hypothetical protein
MSKLHDEFVGEIGRSESIDDNVHSLMESIADRIDACKGNKVRLSDLSTVLREDPKAVSVAVQKVVVVKPTKIETDKAEADKVTADRVAAEKAAADKKAADDKVRADQLQHA